MTLELLLSLVLAFRGALATWEVVNERSVEASGGGDKPAIRYNHGAVVVGDQMVISHGYFYNRENGRPEWLHDTWSLSLTGDRAWERLAVGIEAKDAFKALKDGRMPSSPSGRYGVTLSHYAGKLYLFGGTDGGASKHGNSGYEPGYEMSELWEFDLSRRKWRFLNPKEGSHRPEARYLHSAAVIDDALYVYGGNSDGAGNVISWDFKSRQWSEVASEKDTTDVGPGPRLGHASIPVDTPQTRGFLIFGGRRRKEEVDKLAGDAWLFDARRRKWKGPLSAAVPKGTRPPPAPRVYSAMAAVSLPANADEDGPWGTAAVLTMGSVTTPVMSCNNEAWGVFLSNDTSVIAFQPLPDTPLGHYHHSLVGRGSAVYSFGGHLCSTTKGEHPFYYLNRVESLDVAGIRAPRMAELEAAERAAKGAHEEL
mmetsp:Transcript_42939/g.101953  ORF Transcript_42939/g.101953 Transcript_42939/m.101953 type:complete len:424 (+) Transcript_42939:141-1412(+)